MSQDDVRLSPELIAQLNKLATYLTEQGEYEAVDLIDTVVARVSAMPRRELLAEALDVFTRIERELSMVIDSKQRVSVPISIAFESARAAADKIRAAMGGK